MDRKSMGITIFGYLFFIPGITILIFNLLSLLLAVILGRIEIIISTFGIFLRGIAIGIVCLICGKGLLKFKKWGLKLFFYFSIFGIIYGGYGLWYKLQNPIKYNNFWIIINIISILSWFFAIWFFTRKRIIAQFK